MITPSGSLTETGERALELGEHPRIAQMLLRGSEEGLGYEAALLAAILGERPPLESSNLSFALETIHERLRRGDPSLERLRRSLERYGRLLGIAPGPTVDHRAAGILLALAYPERIALRREERGRYRSAGGRGFRLRPEDSLGRYELFCVAETGGEGSEETIRLAAALSRQEELEAFGLINEREELRFDEAGGRVEARRIFECASLVLESRPLPLPKGPAVARMLLDGIRRRGAQALVWSQEAKNLLLRVRCIRRHLGESWPDWSDERLLERLEEWLLPWIEGMSRLEDLGRCDWHGALQNYLGWERQKRLDALLPPTLSLPTGTRAPIDYADAERPLLSARLQELFGWRNTPALLEGRLPLTIRLLSPAGRPLAVTRDLESFWRDVYPEVRKEMRGRYPKHYWPEDPFSATATKGTKKQMREDLSST